MGREAESPVARFLARAKDVTPVYGALTGIVGGALYVFVTMLCIWVYDPLGVSPAEVGLGYGALLIRTGVALVWLIAFYLVILGPIGLAMRGIWKRRYWQLVLFVVAPCAFLLTIYGTWNDRDRMQDGKPPGTVAFGPPTPWNVDVARVVWTGESPPAGLELPDCLLYLGRADGVSVFYDARPGQQRSLRIPSASVAVAVLPDLDSVLGC